MSRRRGEFEHRTSIFEGAFRAWSHLGGLEPLLLEEKLASELDPLTYPLENDTRLRKGKGSDDDKEHSVPRSGKKKYPYEALPRAGLTHPFVQAILSPWLGPDADQDAIQLGLTTLRTWWQHRRKGESGSAVSALGTEKMRGVVEGYTRHFFNLAHCLVMNDGEQPPRTLMIKMRQVEKTRSKHDKKKAREDQAGKLATAALALNAGMSGEGSGCCDDGTGKGDGDDAMDDSNLTPLERLHAAQRRKLAEIGGVRSSLGYASSSNENGMPVFDMKGKCVPGKIDLPELVNKVSQRASQLAHRGGLAPADSIPSGIVSSFNNGVPMVAHYGDPNTTPVVLVSENGDIQIAMVVDGITCAHCVLIVETVLLGCNGAQSPIVGLLDAAAEKNSRTVILKIDLSSNAKRIAFEAARNLSMVGYSAKPKEMSIISTGNGNKHTIDVAMLTTAFEVVAATDPRDVFDWNTKCNCPDTGERRADCPRHSQMNERTFDAFDTREAQVTQYIMAGCGMKYGMDCSCGPNCRCKGCTKHPQNQQLQQNQQFQMDQPHNSMHPSLMGGMQGEHPMLQPGMQQFHPNEGLPVNGNLMNALPPNQFVATNGAAPAPIPMHVPATRSGSIISFAGSGRHMSITSETTFGRAMSGLSTLSIDWENMEDFDVNVDHSADVGNYSAGMFGVRRGSAMSAIDPLAEVNQFMATERRSSGIASDAIMEGCAMLHGGECMCGPSCVCIGCTKHDQATSMPDFSQPPPQSHQGSLRQNRGSILRRNSQSEQDAGQNMNVSFQV
uniref:HMA domain-containing protein n=1 Tax=Attheya septentrionalis TaxID=420275 RepID=A0A7S2UFT2_9STRA|mmetsp:Transcript_23718/g.42791  ORF Transcript_23718/g.42791 Transcript_23718/m.42791 type:complete len:782 (+) Transcript_23718:410-2755(+)